ncbi:MAG: RHS repeat-associated core domain-containing protein, partial [Prevotellaceae bacterium]|nr:RHS repeat-associated core domain-containing protein [Candidatus Faecinaster equi]
MNQSSSIYRITTSNNTYLGAVMPSSFTGKELDEETGYGYFGARYMDHELMAGWLSVDPMADKYPNISPYAYCAWNPMKLVDPDGRDVYINGDDDSKAKALQQIQQKSKNMKFSINEQGQLTYEGKAKTRQEKYMKNIIECQNIHVNLQVQDNS